MQPGAEQEPLPTRAVNDRVVPAGEFVRMAGETFDTALYPFVVERYTSTDRPEAFQDNYDFWSVVLEHRRLYQGKRIRLLSFWLSEWLPSSPGTYFTPSAVRSRQAALEYWHPGNREYLPLGKGYLVVGGIGCVRLRSRIVDGRRVYFLGASSSGVFHQGIPLVVPEAAYLGVADHIAASGGCCVHVSGTLQMLSSELAIVRYDRDIPRFVIEVDTLEVVRQRYRPRLVGTAAILFPSTHYFENPEYNSHGLTTRLKKCWSYATFAVDRADHGLRPAVDWLASYVERYSGVAGVPIFAEFDEHARHFENVEFPLADIVDLHPDVTRLKMYADRYKFVINTEVLIMGDMFSNITNSTIVNRSIVERSLNTVSSRHSAETAAALRLITEAVERSGNADAVTSLEQFHQELTKTQPDKSILKRLWDGIVTAVPTVAQLSEAVSKLAQLF